MAETANKRKSQCFNESKVKSHKLWMKLISSCWFSYFLQYLTLKEIAKLDSAFCNHDDRIQWLSLLTEHSVQCLKIPRKNFVDKFIAWLVLKRIHTTELEILLVNDDKIPRVPNESLISLINNCSHLQRLEIKSSSVSNSSNLRNLSVIFTNTLNSYTNLEILKLAGIDLSENGYELLSQSCHELKVLHAEYVALKGINKLLKTNTQLEEIMVQSYAHDDKITGDTLEVLGLYCLQLKSCNLSFSKSKNKITNTQIEMFTKGCRYLRYLNFTFESSNSQMVNALLKCLGTYNPLLEESIFYYDYTTSYQGNQGAGLVNSESIKTFSMGCTKLKKFKSYNYSLPTQSVNYLINNCTQLEDLTLNDCDICNDGLIITKESHKKLQHLKNLNVSGNDYITDESFTNIIMGCNSIESVNISACEKLTDMSSFSIYLYAPNLKKLYI